jgi:hypothetical protein
MSTEPATPTETDYAQDEAAVLLAEIQLRHLAELRELGMDLAREILTRKQAPQASDLAYARISKTVLQIVALEQHTIGLRDKKRETLRSRKRAEKKAAVTRGVDAALQAAQPKLDRVRQQSLLRDVFVSYDFSDPRDVATIVAGICRNLGVPYRPEIWPAEAASEPAETVSKPAERPSRPAAAAPPHPPQGRTPPLNAAIANIRRTEAALGGAIRVGAPVAEEIAQHKGHSAGPGPP